MQNKFSEHKTERDREMDEVTQSLTLHVENLQVSSSGWSGCGLLINQGFIQRGVLESPTLQPQLPPFQIT